MNNAIRTYNTTNPDGPDLTDPFAIDWPARQARALVPFEVVDGLPINPVASDLPVGRGELWHWGEAVAADVAAVCLDDAGTRRLLMVERSDGHGWALPGGMLDPGETPRAAAARELREETGLDVAVDELVMIPARGVPDPRAGTNAWIVTVPAFAWIDEMVPVEGRDDARAAAWIPADSYAELAKQVNVFPAHVELVGGIIEAVSLAVHAAQMDWLRQRLGR